jgi:hypothetical protein
VRPSMRCPSLSAWETQRRRGKGQGKAQAGGAAPRRQRQAAGGAALQRRVVHAGYCGAHRLRAALLDGSPPLV